MNGGVGSWSNLTSCLFLFCKKSFIRTHKDIYLCLIHASFHAAVAELGSSDRLRGQQSLKPHTLEKKIVDSCITYIVLKKSKAPFNTAISNVGFSVRSQMLCKP